MSDLVLGLGNPLMADDGLGLAVLERLREDWAIPDDVLLVDGGTWGMNLLPMIEDADRVILVDAIESGAVAGSPVRLERDALPRFFSHKLSPHQIDLREVLALAELRGTLPEDIVALGLQPGAVTMAVGLTPALAAGLEGVADAVAAQLERWGHACRRRAAAANA
jgi:hydrogenase maturation protease